ncbi:XPB/Ssl2-like helicase family protein [Pseudonocardia hierapolitana]|uniref:XPB/Ssl2-like helicase family protein n=1 Tax=Pseudonocardia hierapolitana TaxID=1128676 RepID=A0A561SQF9_9PSEU|nr:helicase-associated domain-containing protein [Pseudonocardia hierapolitana]TWF77081.1 XPB/Ssl2-like helicase family protein [Pseudonocardia hierapolitana]
MSGSAGLAAWLATLSTAELEAILRARPDVLRHPAPTDLAVLADRLAARASVNRALPELSKPALQVAEALLALGGSASREELYALLRATDAPDAVDAAVAELTSMALAWSLKGRVRQVGGWGAISPDPLGLGRSGRKLYGRLTAEQLDRIGAHHGVHGLGRAGIDTVVAVLSDPGAVPDRLSRAGPRVAEAVRQLAWHGPRRSGVQFPEPGEPVEPHDVARQLALQGWAVPTEWGIAEMPREVALAVRGPEYHAPFDAHPPCPATAPVDPGQLRAAGGHAAVAALDSVRSLVTLLDHSPLTTVQGGGIGVRELRRAAKELGSDLTVVRLGLEIAAAAGLVALAREGPARTSLRRGHQSPVGVALPTEVVDEWLAAEPADAYARLLLAWWRLPMVPSLRVDESGRPAPALVRAYGHPEHLRMRSGALAALATLGGWARRAGGREGHGPGRGLVDLDAVHELLAHRAPLDRGLPDDAAKLRATLAEAELLGLIATGALTPLGHELLAAVRTDEPHAALRRALAGVLPAPTGTATFLPDLTALVTGIAAAPLTRLLDAVADAERRDITSVWRFTAASVRRALDAGHTADGLLAALASAADHPLPQPLEYLVRDVARRHGQVQVCAVATCVRVADPALGAELAAQRGLAPLRLRPLTDTVLVSDRPAAEVMGALRSAGYSPVEQDASGTAVITRAPVRRAPAPAEQQWTGNPIDVAALAAPAHGRCVGTVRGCVAPGARPPS